MHPINRAIKSGAFGSFSDVFLLPFLTVMLENFGSNDRHDIVGEKWITSQGIGLGPVMESVNQSNRGDGRHVCVESVDANKLNRIFNFN